MPPTSKSSGAKRRRSELPPELPPELIFQVLSYLPVKSLLRFKSVCKSWRDFISDDPHFVALHSKRSKKLKKQCTLTPSVLPELFLKGIFSCSIELFSYELFSYDIDEHESHLCWKLCTDGGVIMKLHPYSVNGVVLIYSQAVNDVCLWNPSTRESISLPHSTLVLRRSGFYELFYEFGVDLSTNEFKVIRLIRRLDNPNPYVCEIYASRTGYWKKVDVPLDPNFFWDVWYSSIQSVCMDGVAYWLFTSSGPTNTILLLAFSLADELWRVIPLPEFGVGGGNYPKTKLSFCKVGGFLCLSYPKYSNDPFDTHDIWVYSDEGTNCNGWSKKHRKNLSKWGEERRPQQKFAEQIGKGNLRSFADAGDSDNDHDDFEQAFVESLCLDDGHDSLFKPTLYTETLVSLRQKIKPINC